MESRIFCAYNETSKCFLSTRVTVVDAALEPLRVLRVLMEGLGPDASDGAWLIHFKGVPVARAISPFDLIYLDKDFRVVHGIELFADSSFEPFKGQPSSALILPTRTLTASKTRSGHQINFREIFDASAQTPAITQPPVPKGRHLPAAPPSQGAETGGLISAFAGLAAPGSSVSQAQTTMHSAGSSAPAPAAPLSGSGSLTRATSQTTRPGLDRPPIANVPSRVVPASVPKSIQSQPELGPSARAVNASGSGRLLRTAPSHPEMSAVAQPALPEVTPEDATPAPASEPQPPHGLLIPFPAAPVSEATPEPASQPQETVLPGMSPPFKWDELKTPPNLEIAAPELDEEVPSAEMQQALEAEQALEQETRELQVRNTRIDQALAPASKTRRNISWDVHLLYAVFPEFDPERETDFRIPRTDFLNEGKARLGEPSRKLQFLSWLYPDLHLERVEKTRREARAAPRLADPGLVAHFFTGGSPRPHPVKNISVSGFYMYTDERWLPGTIIRVTLQILGSSGDDPRDIITVHSRVVRWGVDGGGFEFVLPGFLEE
ncbi:MAG: hypothetical protein WCC26_21870 [Terracidiphilus sp.]